MLWRNRKFRMPHALGFGILPQTPLLRSSISCAACLSITAKWPASFLPAYAQVSHPTVLQSVADFNQPQLAELSHLLFDLSSRFVCPVHSGKRQAIFCSPCAARPLTSTAIARLPSTPTSAIHTRDSSPSTSLNMTAIAMQGSNQLSLETPKNGAGGYNSHVRSAC